MPIHEGQYAWMSTRIIRIHDDLYRRDGNDLLKKCEAIHGGIKEEYGAIHEEITNQKLHCINEACRSIL